jgi:hypothetical protein
MFKFYGYFFIFLFIVTGACFSSAKNMRFIVLPPETSADLQLAAEDLAGVIALRSGERPVIMESRWRFPKDAIFIGDSPVTVPSLRLPRTLSSYGSVARRGPDNRIFLRARNDAALVHGVYTLAREEWGARWFLVHRNDFFLVAIDPVEQLPAVGRRLNEPAFVQRHTPAILRLDNGNFYRRNRLNQVYHFNHALANWFNPTLFNERPELFAMRRGQRMEPRGSRGTDAQPHLAAQATAEFAADAVLEYFEKNPSAVSFSLSINDNILFDESEETRAIVEPISWFRGKPNYTDLVFTFMNRVAEKVFNEGGAWYNDQGEPRYLTALAYYWAEAAPSFPIHPRVMPILTSDHAQWHDPNYRHEDRALIQAWTSSGAEKIGTWSYYYGAPYPYPRQFNRHLIDSIRHMRDSGLRVFYAEMPHIFPFDGPKAYLMAQLLWNPLADTEGLLQEYYHGVFGPAADTMRAFYEAFELMRDQYEGSAEWIKFYMDEAGVELYPLPFLRQMETKLIAAQEMVEEHSLYVELLQEVRRDYTLTITYAELQAARRTIVEAIETGELELIPNLIVAFEQLKASLNKQLETLKPVDRYHYNLRLLRFPPQSDPTKAALGALLSNCNDQEIEEIATLLPKHASTLLELHPHFHRGFGDSVLINPMLFNAEPRDDGRYLFPQPMPQVPGWFIDARPAEDFTVGGIPEIGNRGIRFSGADAASFLTDVNVEPNELYLLKTELHYQISPDNRTILQVIWYDADDRRIKSERLVQLPTTWDKGERRKAKGETAEDGNLKAEGEALLTIPLRSPDSAARVRIRFSISRQYPGDFLEIRAVELKTTESFRK